MPSKLIASDVLPFDERAVRVEAEAAVLLGAQRRRERVARVQRLVAEAEVGHPAPAVHARLGDDVDAEAAASRGMSAAKEFMRKRIDWICDFGGSRPPRNPLTRIVAPGPAICIEQLLELVGVVGQLGDLLRRSAREVKALPRTSSRAVAHDDLLVQPGQRQRRA